MAFNYLDLIGGKSAQQIINDFFAFLASPPDPSLVSVRTANWRTGGPYRTLVYRQGIEVSLLYQILAQFAGSASLQYASGGWLDWLGVNFFDESRQSGEFATVPVTFNVPLGAGPLGPLALRVQTSDGKVFASTQPETLPAGPMSITFTMRAVEAGSKYNVGANLINQLITPNVLGISVNNASPATGGFDTESDDRYRQRLGYKWGVLATGSPAAAYAYWAMQASKEVQKVRVYSNLHLGAFDPEYVTVVMAGNNTGVSPQALIDVGDYIDPRMAICAKLNVATAIMIPVAVTGNVQVFSPYANGAPAQIGLALSELTKRVPIGSYDAGAIPVSEVMDSVFYSSKEVYDVSLTTPSAPIPLNYNEMAVFTDATTIIPVAP